MKKGKENSNCPGPCESREKNWGELTVEEKLERMRARVRQLEADNNARRRVMNELLNHEHGKEGKPVGRIERENSHFYKLQKEDEYF